jgi:hypothetical protein
MQARENQPIAYGLQTQSFQLKCQRYVLNKLKTMLSRCFGLTVRCVMRTFSVILRPRGRLDALSAAIQWFVKRNNHKPLELEHSSTYGDFHLMSDGYRIQLTWWIDESEQDTRELQRSRFADRPDHVS